MTMIHKWLSRVCLCTMVLVMLMGSNFTIAGEQQQTGEVTALFEAKDEYILGTPMPVMLRVKNGSSKRVMLSVWLDFWFSATHLSSGRILQFPKRFISGSGGESLAPGETYTKLVYLNKYLPFELPGTYALECNAYISKRMDKFRTGKSARRRVHTTSTVNLRRGSEDEIKRIIQRLEGDLESKDRQIRNKAIEALASMRLPSVVGALGRASRSNHPNVWSQAVTALARIGAPAAFQDLNYLYPGGRSNSLAQIAGPEAIQELVNTAKYAPSLPNRKRAIVALGRTRDKTVISCLIDFLEDPSPTIREGAIVALGSSRDKTAIPYLIDLLEDPSPTIRLAALQGFQNAGRPSCCIAAVESRLDDSDKRVRTRAATLLAGLIIPVSEYVPKGKTREKIKQIFIKALEESKHPTDKTIKRYESRASQMASARMKVLHSLANLGDTDVIAVIKKIDKEDPYFKDLSKTKNHVNPNYTGPMKRYIVREAAESALRQIELRQRKTKSK